MISPNKWNPQNVAIGSESIKFMQLSHIEHNPQSLLSLAHNISHMLALKSSTSLTFFLDILC